MDQHSCCRQSFPVRLIPYSLGIITECYEKNTSCLCHTDLGELIFTECGYQYNRHNG